MDAGSTVHIASTSRDRIDWTILARLGFQQRRTARLLSKMDLDAGDQLANEKRFDDVIVRPKLQPDNAICFRCASGQEDHRNVSEFRIPANTFADLQAIRVRQHDIEQDK